MPKHHQLNLPAAEVRSSEGREPTFRNPEDSAKDAAYALSADLFNAACGDPVHGGLTNQEIAYLWKCSEDLPRKMRSREARACPSLVQLLLLPPSFHLRLHRELNTRFGFGRAALMDLLDAAGRLALAVNE